MAGNQTLSVLVPIYNYIAAPLARKLSAQLQQAGIVYELLCYDDGSAPEYKQANAAIGILPNVYYKELPQNLGRSQIRNKLATDARYAQLLFLDCDTDIDNNFIAHYLPYLDFSGAVIGGVAYARERPATEFVLHWLYGRQREARPAVLRNHTPHLSLYLSNILVSKSVYQSSPLDAEIITYGHEDTKFGHELLRRGVSLLHIDNPVLHLGLEKNITFLTKTRIAVRNFYSISHQQGIGREAKLYRAFALVRHWPLSALFKLVYELAANQIKDNLLGECPRLLYLDLFKLYQLVSEHEEKTKTGTKKAQGV